jgi:hypothetical protein
MPRILRNLKITEISSVDKGAGDGVRIVLMKRYDERSDRWRRMFTKALRQGGNRPITPDYDAGAEHLANITKSRREPPMSRVEKLKAIAKRYGGVATIAKGMLTDNDAYGVTEFEFTEMMKAEAARRGVPFEKYFCDPANIDIRRAHQLTKNVPVAKDSLLRPVMVEPVSVETGRTDTESDAEEAYAQLMQMAEELAASGKYQSVASAFAALFQDQRNAELAAKAHKRPNAANANPYPR